MNASDLQAMTPAQLQALTKAQIIAAILDGITDTALTRAEDGPHGQLKRVDANRERLTGKVTGRSTTTWSYYPTSGCVDEITTVEANDKGKEISRRVVKHFTDGKQPETHFLSKG